MKSKQIELNNKAGIYLRLSKDDEKAGESLSIENQRLILQKYAVEHGFEIVDEYIDDGYSGTSFERPEVQRLLEDAKIGRINIIIVKDLSRFGRNYIQVGQFVDYIFPMYNIRFIALSDALIGSLSFIMSQFISTLDNTPKAFMGFIENDILVSEF